MGCCLFQNLKRRLDKAISTTNINQMHGSIMYISVHFPVSYNCFVPWMTNTQ
uniref:Uncharacterized protein n=1 Tax=Arundo donax TaxID=35708 RepID=A0A0A9AVE0_ARUDO